MCLSCLEMMIILPSCLITALYVASLNKVKVNITEKIPIMLTNDAVFVFFSTRNQQCY